MNRKLSRTTWIRSPFNEMGRLLLDYIEVHQYIVADASGDAENVEYFMCAKARVSMIEESELECIDYTTNGVDDTANEQP